MDGSQNPDTNTMTLSSVVGKLMKHMYPGVEMLIPDEHQNLPIKFNFKQGTGHQLSFEQFQNEIMFQFPPNELGQPAVPDFANLDGQPIQMTQYLVTQVTTENGQPICCLWNNLSNAQPGEQHQEEEFIEDVNEGVDDDQEDGEEYGAENEDGDQQNPSDSESEEESGFESESAHSFPHLNDEQFAYMKRVWEEEDEEEREIAELHKNMARSDSLLQKILEKNNSRRRRIERLIECIERLPKERENDHPMGIYFPHNFENHLIEFMIDPKNNGDKPWVQPKCPITRAEQALHKHETDIINGLVEGRELDEDDRQFMRERRGFDPMKGLRRREEPVDYQLWQVDVYQEEEEVLSDDGYPISSTEDLAV